MQVNSVKYRQRVPRVHPVWRRILYRLRLTATTSPLLTIGTPLSIGINVLHQLPILFSNLYPCLKKVERL